MEITFVTFLNRDSNEVPTGDLIYAYGVSGGDWLYGYGLDLDGKYREAREIFKLNK